MIAVRIMEKRGVGWFRVWVGLNVVKMDLRAIKIGYFKVWRNI